MPVNSRGPNNTGKGPGKGAAVGPSFLSLPKDPVKPPSARPAPAVWTQPPANKLRQPPPSPVKPPPQLPPPALGAAAAAGKAAGGLSLGAAATALAIAIASVLLFDSPVAAPTLMHPSEPPVPLQQPGYPFRGGQGVGIPYFVDFSVSYKGGGLDDPTVYTDQGRVTVNGPISGMTSTVANTDTSGNVFTNIYVVGGNGSVFAVNRANVVSYKITKITRVSGAPDTTGDPPPSSPGINSSPGNYLGPPSAAPPSTAPSPAPKAPPPFRSPSGVPGSNPGGVPGSNPGGVPGDQTKRVPGGLPGGFPSPTPAPNPGPDPQPNRYPGPAPSPSPNPSPNGDPGPSPGPGIGPAPSPTPTPNGAPRIGPSPFVSPPPVDPTKYPDTGFQPKIHTPSPLAPNPLTPTPLGPSPTNPNQTPPSPFTPNPKTGDPEPKAPPLIPPPTTPGPTPKPDEDLLEKIKNLIIPLGIGLVGLTGLVQPEKLREAANQGSCQSFAPGGCNAPIANNAQAAATNSANNGTALASIMAFLQAIQTLFLIPIKAGVELVNTKLGPLMSGVNGIGGFLGRLNTSLGVDRVINLVTTAGVIHNCMMLSSSISDTLFSTLDNVFAIPSLIKDPEGATVDSKEAFTKHLDGMFAGIFGAAEWTAIKNQWKAYSTIYNTGTQVFGNMRDIFDETSQIQEVTKNWVAELGNGLQDEGLIGEDNWNVKDPKKSIKGKYFARLQRIADGLEQVENVAEDLEQITSSARNIVETANEIKENTTAISKAVTDANKAAKADRDAKEEGLELPNFSLEDLF